MKLILIGCSTGGPGHLSKILKTLPPDYKGCIIIAQHIAEAFLPSLVQNFESECKLPLYICADGTALREGSVYFAKGEHINEIKARGGSIVWSISSEISDTYAPNINRLFYSASKLANSFEKMAGILLTGIGDDGAKGLLELKMAGSLTIAESEESAIVYGMPRSAKEINAAVEILNISEIITKIANFDR
jgi:two-component system chemotaxis response regulator CheB